MRKLLNLIMLPALLVSLVAQAGTEKVSRSKEISDWEDVVVEKGFILSNDLYYSRLCAKIWSKQIPEFKKKNPNVKDVNKFWPGDKITIQICNGIAANSNQEVVPTVVKTKKSKKKVVTIVESTDQTTDLDGESYSEKPSEDLSKKLSSEGKILEEEDFTIFLGLGFLAEKYNAEVDSTTSLRLGMKKDILPHVEYDLTMDLSQPVIIASNKIKLKSNGEKRKFFASFGMGNRIGLQKRPEEKLSNTFNTYSVLGAGIMFNTSNVDFSIELGTTLNSQPGVNLSVMGVKKISEKLSLGGYFDLLSTDPKINDSKDARQLITGGVVLLF